MNLLAKDWVSLIKKDYLGDFIRSGGAAVKFAIPMNESVLGELVRDLRKSAETDAFQFVSVDSRKTKLHMIDQLFYAVAREIDWRRAAYIFVSNTFKAEGYRLPSETTKFSLKEIARLNDREEMFLRTEVRRWLEKRIFRDFKMCQEFRIAMIRLCLAQLDGEGDESLFETAIIQWLRGELIHISELKGAHIFQRIRRHNARHMLISLARWLKLIGQEGLVLLIDASRYMIDTRPKTADDTLYYGVVAVIDAYEVLRQFVDGTDEVENCLMIVVSTPEFLTDELRGVGRYDALKLRIWDDVRDKNRPNPLAPLVRLGTKGGPR